MTIVKCDYCGKEKELENWEVKRSKTHFCNNLCKSKSQYKENTIKIKSDYAEMIINDVIVLFDIEDIEIVNGAKWFAKYDKTVNNYYIVAHERNNYKNRKDLRLHNLVMDCPLGLETDHINRNTLDNRKCNLRNVTPLENKQNKGTYKNNKSGYKYIYFHKPHNRYIVEIKIDGKAKHIGSSKELNNAIEIRDNFLKEVMPNATV